jgi:phosphatidylinositol alpha-1,6-mannosyltransferase
VGGIGQWALRVTRTLCEQGHQVTVYAQAESIGRSTMHAGAPYRVVKMFDYEWRRLRSTWVSWYNARIVFGDRHDLIIATHWALGSSAVYLSRLHPKKVMVVLHGSEVLRKRNWLEYRRFAHTLRHASLVVAVSEAVKRETLRVSDVDPDRITVIHNGTDPDLFRPAPPSRELAARLGLEDRRVIITVARLADRKGHDTIVRALPRILKRHPNAAYLVVGGHPPAIEALRSLASSLGVEKQVVFTGRIPNPETVAHYNLAEVFALISRDVPRKFEGFGISLVEAGACEKPVVAGRSGGVPEVVEDGVTGYVVDPTSEEEVADRIIRLLDQPDLARGMGRAARARVEKLFTWKHNVRRMVDCLESASGS